MIRRSLPLLGLALGATIWLAAADEPKLPPDRVRPESLAVIKVREDGIPEVFRTRIEKRLSRRIKDIEQIFSLTDEQRRKLRLAGRGDIVRVSERIREVSEDFSRARRTGDHDAIARAEADLTLLDMFMADGLFELNSLFEKTLRKMVAENRVARRQPASGDAPKRT